MTFTFGLVWFGLKKEESVGIFQIPARTNRISGPAQSPLGSIAQDTISTLPQDASSSISSSYANSALDGFWVHCLLCQFCSQLEQKHDLTMDLVHCVLCLGLLTDSPQPTGCGMVPHGEE